MPVEFTPDFEVEDGGEGADSLAEDPLQGPDGAIDCTNGRYNFVMAWLGKLGIGEAELDGSALIFGEGCSLAIVHPVTGEVLTPAEIAKRVTAASKPRAIN